MAGRLLPGCFEDIIVSISLVRPGPLKSNMDKSYLARRHGAEPVTYLHYSLKNALEETLGVILYQEQVLRVAHDLGGMSYAEADGFRRAMTHERTGAEMENMRDIFISGALKNGVSQDIAQKVFEQLAAFAAYGFCKAHAVAYAILTYQMLWLKCHYPAEFFAALLSNQPMGYYPPRVLIADARRFGVRILPLDVNNSLTDYSVENGAIRIGFLQLKGISGEDIQSILKARNQKKFVSLQDFVMRTGVSRPILIKLTKIGAFDAIDDRRKLLAMLPSLHKISGKVDGICLNLFTEDMFQVWDNATASPEYNIRENLLVEKELLSLDLCAHPLDLHNLGDDFTRIKELPAIATGTIIKIAGSVIRYQTPPTRNGKRVVYVIMEDGTGIADITVFSDVQERCGQVLFRAGWLIVEGKVQRRGPKAVSIIALELMPLNFD
ncbi:MAG: OB-fold nucleic acid binding domain-containing protein, partial [Planctomycetota bacterium]